VIPAVRPTTEAMRLQPITYRGRLVACATATHVFLAEDLERRLAGDLELTFVAFMCFYAHDGLTGALPHERYSDERARTYARAALVPDEILERRLPDPRRTARALGVPVNELLQAHCDHRPPGTDLR